VKIINRTVLLLSLVSFFADIASEMLYPVVPIYLKEIGFSVLLIGVLEGLAEFTAGLSKGYFGKKSDERGLRIPFIKSGYLMSALSKPMMGVLAIPLWIFAARTLDRLGKGVRTAARDALLAQNATPQTKARVFGFHRSLDTAGAVLGPALALLFLYFIPGNYRMLFFLALVPGLLSVALVYFIREQREPPRPTGGKGFFSYFGYWRQSTPEYKKLVAGLLLFALVNSSDVFLLLKTKEVTGSDTTTLMVYILYNVVFAAAAYPLGMVADRWGFRKVFISGLVLFAAVYAVLGMASAAPVIVASFVGYGIYAAATESIAKAWITNSTRDRQTATAIGFYTSCQSICSLLASIIAGLVWTTFNSTVLFLGTAIATSAIAVYFLLANNKSLAVPVTDASSLAR
jgi:MFS family permease